MELFSALAHVFVSQFFLLYDLQIACRIVKINVLFSVSLLL